ncbi:type II toxin-antitoxin system VapC family toxin [Desulfonatronovibrio magnus]|uniref:type II toxin-antitoxin system VapC family toxin n=1 Tax=Desulfonatronovibrio magnus TaxID=698827 RepID=UPI0005EB1C3B|nr:PIN domain-containing protein [Desulfonatronovibrio magnus]
MKGILVDSNIILDIFLDDPNWADWSESTLTRYGGQTNLYINSVIYSEVSIGFKKIEELESALNKGGFRMLEIPREALFLAGKAYLQYKKRKGSRKSPLPDFYIGAQAAVLDLDLITRDRGRYGTYFPAVRTICPE